MFIKEHQQLLSKYKRENKPTEAELLFEDVLKELNIPYMKQKGFVAKAYSCFIADFYLPKPYKTIIEIDGLYHDKEKDEGRDWFFKTHRGINTVRFSNEEVFTSSKEDLAAKLKLFLNKET